MKTQTTREMCIDYINYLRSTLEQKLNSSDFDVLQEVRWGALSKKIIFDIGIFYRGNLIAVGEIVPEEGYLHVASHIVRPDVFYLTPAKLLFVSFAKDNKFLISKDRYDDFNTCTLDDIVDIIQELSQSDITPGKKHAENGVTCPFELFRDTKNILSPDWCRQNLKEYNKEEICRYSSLDSFFSSIKFKTIRMNGLPGMNDRDEGLCAWNLVYDKDNDFTTDFITKRDMEINNAFIVSYSDDEKIDKLTQWRLYGDDGKGVCCVYSIDKEKLKGRFYLHSVSYISKFPPIEDKLLDDIKKYVDDNNKEYFDLSPVIFFYKPKDFDVEAEVRLLVDNKRTTAYSSDQYKREWVLTYSNSIPNPYIDVPMNDIPLKLTKVILGPSMNDVDIIAVQIKTMLEQQGIKGVDVYPSDINSYRNPIN